MDFQCLLLKIGNSYSFENLAELLILISFDPNRTKKNMSILGRDIPSQRKNRTLLKRTTDGYA